MERSLKKTKNRSSAFRLPVVLSILFHVTLVAGVAFFFLRNAALIKGDFGRAGRPDAQMGLTLAIVEDLVASEITERKIPLAREGVAIPVTELPSEVKNQNPKLIDTPPTVESVGSAGSPGNFGSGNGISEAVGNANRSNAFGLYLQKIQRKIQANLQSPGEIAFSYRVLLKLRILMSGRIESITIEKSSGDARLDRLAVAAAKKSDPFEPYEKSFAVIVPVHFRAL